MSSNFRAAVLAVELARCLVWIVKQTVVLGLLKQVSRSFYVSLRLLPAPMRAGAGLAYLLARASDTIADSSEVDLDLRIQSLDEFASQLAGESPHQSWPGELVLAVNHAGEKELLNKSHRLLEWMHEMPDRQIALIQRVLEIIIRGQRRDLDLFGAAGSQTPVIIGSREDLDDYTYCVAGCVGEFWTRLGFETLGSKFSREDEGRLCELGRDYGKGLQLINILRDVPEDLESGRCYLPVADAGDREALLSEHRIQRLRALQLVHQGLEYASCLKGRRLRMASVMPALLAEDTLLLMEDADWSTLESKVKISRRQVYGNLIQSLLF